MYLKPKTFKVVGELAHEADLLADARGGVPGCVVKGNRETKSQVPHNYANQVDRKSNISCKICGNPIKHIIVGTTRARGCCLVRK